MQMARLSLQFSEQISLRWRLEIGLPNKLLGDGNHYGSIKAFEIPGPLRTTGAICQKSTSTLEFIRHMPRHQETDISKIFHICLFKHISIFMKLWRGVRMNKQHY